LLGRAGAEGYGGSPRGTVYIAWDDNFADEPWPEGFGFAIDEAPGESSIIAGGAGNRSFGEELLGGLDWDLDGAADLYIGDLGGAAGAGVGHVLYDASRLRGLRFVIDDARRQSPAVRTTTLLGIEPGHIAADTAAQGDFDADGAADLAVCSPHASPLGRRSAGIVHVLYGREGGWPAALNLAAPPAPGDRVLTEIFGARGSSATELGDTLCYSAAAGDLDADGVTDLIVNEMVGNGIAPGTEDVGNLILLSGALVSSPRPPVESPSESP
jgi:hypothetical protein